MSRIAAWTAVGISLIVATQGAFLVFLGFDWQRRRGSKRRVPFVVLSPLLLVVGPPLVADNFTGTLMDTGRVGERSS